MCDQDVARGEHVVAYADAVVVVVVAVAAVFAADVAFAAASAVVAADDLAYDSVAYSAGDTFYRYRRRNFSKNH